MKVSSLLKGHLPSIIINALAMLFSSLFLLATGTAGGVIFIILFIWLIILVLFYGTAIYQTHKRLTALIALADSLEEKYLLAEIMKQPDHAVEAIYYELLKEAGKSMMEQVGASRRDSLEYREYVEQWIHDVKTPISGIRLLCDNNKAAWTRTLLVELEKVDHLVEQALFYARSEDPARDYIIRECLVSEIIHAAIMDNKQVLLNNNVRIEYAEDETSIYTDKKWLCFILNQLIINAVQYRNDNDSVIQFVVERRDGGVVLIVRDNGIGIPESDLPRVFDKGFTGTNGRKQQKSTGFGLYLCKRLCEKMGLAISIRSKPGAYTSVLIFFPKGTFTKM